MTSAPRGGLDTDTSSHGSWHRVLDASDISRALTRIAHEILERNKGAGRCGPARASPGVGVPLAARIAAVMSDVEGVKVPHGALDITMYRDDLRLKPARASGAHRDPRRHRRRRRRGPRRRRPLLRTHHPGRPRRAQRRRPAPRRPARRPGRPRPPRAADPRRLRRQEPADQPVRDRARVAAASTTTATP